MNTFPSSRQVSLIHARNLLDHSAANHPALLSHRFITLPLGVTDFRSLSERSGLRPSLAGSPQTPSRIAFVILRTDRSPPVATHLALGDAVTVGYRPESVCLKRTFTSLIA